jgi:hypothetical protein
MLLCPLAGGVRACWCVRLCIFLWCVLLSPYECLFECVSLNDWAGVKAHVIFRKSTLMNPSSPEPDLAFFYTSRNVT